MKNQLWVALLLVSAMFSCSKNEELQTVKDNENLLSRASLNEYIEKATSNKEVFKWTEAPSNIIASALALSDEVAFVGYQPAGTTNLKEKIHQVDIHSAEWVAAKQKVVDLILTTMNKDEEGTPLTATDLNLVHLEHLPVIAIKIKGVEVVDALRNAPEVRYVEPGSYQKEEIDLRSDAGCGGEGTSYVPPADYTNTAPAARIPWNFYNMNIPAAWSTATGDNVTICIIDTGTSPDQPKLNSAQFNQGYSQGRFINRIGTFVDSWWWWADPDGPDDDCGHGTSMSSLATAPRGYGYSATGVAYNANLLSVRGTGDVVINWWREKEGVADGLTTAGNRSDVKVISMSLGDVFWSSTVADGVYYAYNNGKMILSAAGTSTTWTNWYGVIFPATMSQTVAVTGVKDANTLIECDVCHKGNAVDFVAVMERESDASRHGLCLPMSGNDLDYIGGSSAATATTAGIAALVWSTNLSQTRSQVLQRMKNASQFYPARDGDFGWGLIDAQAAVNN